VNRRQSGGTGCSGLSQPVATGLQVYWSTYRCLFVPLNTLPYSRETESALLTTCGKHRPNIKYIVKGCRLYHSVVLCRGGPCPRRAAHAAAHFVMVVGRAQKS
jgi:hypothetical protein